MRELFEAIGLTAPGPETAAKARAAMARLERNPRYAGYFRMQRELAAWLPGFLGADAVIGRADHGALILQRVACYPWGFTFDIASIPRPGISAARPFQIVRPSVAGEELLGGLAAVMRATLGDEFPQPTPAPELHVEFADGSRFHVVDVVVEMAERAAAKSSALEDRASDQRYVRSQRRFTPGVSAITVLAWKLPPPGPVLVEVEWPAHGIPLTRHQLDADAIVHAAYNARRRREFD